MRKKKLLPVVLSFAMIMTMVPMGMNVNAAQKSTLPFKDVKEKGWYFSSVEYAYDYNLMSGTSSETFEPDGKLTRAMFVTILGRLAKVDQAVYQGSSFSDVKTGQWYSAYIDWAVKKNITSGIGDRKFGTDSYVTREQMATFIARYVKAKGIALPDDPSPVKSFKDTDKVDSWALEGLELMRKSGLIKGDENGYFKPLDSATRAQAAAIFERLDKAVRNEKFGTLTADKQRELAEIEELNDGEMPRIAYDSEDMIPKAIIGSYSGRRVYDSRSAIQSLNDISGIMGIEDAGKEFEEESSEQIGDMNYYRLQQMYKGCKVYGKDITVTADMNGNVMDMIGDYDPLDGKVDETIDVSVERAYLIARDYCRDIDDDGTQIVYTLDEGKNEYAWLFTGSRTVIISAKDGTLLDVWDNVIESKSSSTGTGKNVHGNDVTFNTTRDDNNTSSSSDDIYLFHDSVRNISYYDLNKVDGTSASMEYPDGSGYNGPEVIKIMRDQDNDWTGDAAEKAITLCQNVSKVYDYYHSVLGIDSFDNKGSHIQASVNCGFDNGNNAFSKTWYGGARLSFGYNRAYYAHLDVVCHEFTHSVEHALVEDLVYKNETGALMEAYSDAAGELAEIYWNGIADWVHREDGRNSGSPKKSNNPDKYMGDNWIFGDWYDNGGIHDNSTVISHAICLMYTRGLNNIDKLSELLYRAWGKLPSDGDFQDYRSAVLSTAENMGFSSAQLNLIERAFNEVGITVSYISPYVKVGDSVLYGNYEQDGISYNGKEPIEWTVLKKENGRLMLLSRYGLEQKHYNDYTGGNITWENCTMRKWLNETFFNEAFSVIEQGRIPQTNVVNPDFYMGSDSSGEEVRNNTGAGIKTVSSHVDGGNNTKDNVYLLSIDEAMSLLGYTKGKVTKYDGSQIDGFPSMQAPCTEYASDWKIMNPSAYTSSKEYSCGWWLRTPSQYTDDGSYVDAFGRLSSEDFEGNYCNNKARPVIWVDLQ